MTSAPVGWAAAPSLADHYNGGACVRWGIVVQLELSRPESVSLPRRVTMVAINVNSLLLAAALLIGIAVQSGEGIRCWVCSSDVDRRCGDPFNMTHLAVTDCDRERAQSPYLQSLAVCKKTKQRVNSELITVRSCTWETDAYGTGPCSANAISQYAKVEYCSTCTHDACNGGHQVRGVATPHLHLALIASAAVVTRFRR